MTPLMAVAIVFAHMIGDYILQSDWMALEKTQKWLPAIAHGIVYTIPYLVITLNVWSLLIICVTHIIIDHYRLVRHFIWIKNFLAPRRYWYKWKDCNITGYHKDGPAWLTTWLMIITDNVVHLMINFTAILLFLGE